MRTPFIFGNVVVDEYDGRGWKWPIGERCWRWTRNGRLLEVYSGGLWHCVFEPDTLEEAVAFSLGYERGLGLDPDCPEGGGDEGARTGG